MTKKEINAYRMEMIAELAKHFDVKPCVNYSFNYLIAEIDKCNKALEVINQITK